jgi:hypothetical protein
VWVARATSGSGGAVVWPPQQIDAVYCAQEVAAAAGYQLDTSEHCLDAPLSAGVGTVALPSQPVTAASTPLVTSGTTAAPVSPTSAPPLATAPPPTVVAGATPAPAAASSAAPTTAPGGPAATGTAPAPVASDGPTDGSLPLTGTATRVLARSGTALMLLGIALVLASHRRRPTPPAGPSGRRFPAASP